MKKKRRKSRNKPESKMTYSDFLMPNLKDFGLVFLFFLIIAIFHGIENLIIWLSMSLVIFIGIVLNALSEYNKYLKNK